MKTIQMIAIFAMSLILVSCAVQQTEPVVEPREQITPEESTAPLPPPTPAQSENAQGAPIADLASAFALGQKVKCTYKGEQNGETIDGVMYVKGDKFRFDGATGKAAVHTIFDNVMYYVWGTQEGVEYGIKMTVKKDSPQASGQPVQTKEELVKGGQDVRCSRDSFAESILLPPADVKFQDFDALLAGLPGQN